MDNDSRINNRSENFPGNTSSISSKTESSNIELKDFSVQLEDDVYFVREYKSNNKNRFLGLNKRFPRIRNTRKVCYEE